MLGGCYLCYEGARRCGTRSAPPTTTTGRARRRSRRETIVSGAVRTDFILSAEIMVIALNEVVDQGFVSRAIILAVVAVGITVLVYGVVGLIVKMDDVGLHLSERPSKGVARLGRGLVKGMPKLLTALTVIGTAAMLGSAATSCWSAPTTSACTSCTAPSTTWRRSRTRPPGDSAGSWPGSSTPWPARSSGSSSA